MTQLFLKYFSVFFFTLSQSLIHFDKNLFYFVLLRWFRFSGLKINLPSLLNPFLPISFSNKTFFIVETFVLTIEVQHALFARFAEQWVRKMLEILKRTCWESVRKFYLFLNICKNVCKIRPWKALFKYYQYLALLAAVVEL